MIKTRKTIELRILGPTELRRLDGSESAIVRQPKQLALLAYLALSTAEGYRRRDQVVGLFWPELDQEAARAQLRKALFGFRESLGADVVQTRGEGEVRVDAEQVWCDAVALMRETRPAEALGLYRGELLDGLFPEGVAQEFQDWLSEQRRVLRERAATAAWDASRADEERGDRRSAAVLARRALELNPDDEDGVRRLMSLLDRHGDRAGALRVYGDWVKRLQDEYGVEPAPETRKLARRVQAARKGESHETPPTPLPPVEAYRAVEPAPAVEPSPALVVRQESPTATGGSRWKLALAAIVLLLAISVGALARRSGGNLDPRSVTVLPMRGIGGPSAHEEALRVSEELTTRLARVPGLAVRSSESESSAWTVSGAVQSGSSLRVTMRLVRNSDGVTVWAATYDVSLDNVMMTVQQLTQDAAVTIQARVEAPDSAR